MADVYTFLEGVIGAGNDGALRQQLAGCMKMRHFKKGSLILEHGSICGGYYILASEGLIKCTFYTPAGKAITECFINRVGQPAVPAADVESPSRYEMEALTDVDLLYIDEKDLQALTAGKGPVWRAAN